MSSLPAHAYAEWRQETIVAPALREAAASPPPERFLQQVWQHQRLLRDRLRAADGRSVRVLHPGFWNVEAGPDFRGAVIQFDQEAPVSGDIEIDLVPGGWQAHRHAGNPAYQRVVLHVVWEAGGKNSIPLPTLALKEALDAPIEDLAEWIGQTSGAPRELAGQCCGPLGQLAAETCLALLHQAAQVRLQRKAALFIARARQAGWEQALWEGLFTALGYKHNVWPMRSLAELLPRLVATPAGERPALIELQGRLFGTGGLLPHELEEKTRANNDYFRGVWDAWWRERDRFAEVAIPARVWRMHGLRPANHPQRRLALAGHWLARGNLADRLEEWFKEAVAGTNQAAKLLAVLSAPDEDFWSTHYTFRSRAATKPQPLLGAQRCTDLAVNVVLPWFWARAATGGNQEARARVERGYFAWPAGEDNAVLRLARQRLLGEVRQKLPATAAVQQGLIQIVRDFCDHADATCAGCRFPGLVSGIGQPRGN